MIVKLLTEHHLEFLNLTGGSRGLSESTHVKMLYCWKSHALAHLIHLSRQKYKCEQNHPKICTFCMVGNFVVLC